VKIIDVLGEGVRVQSEWTGTQGNV